MDVKLTIAAHLILLRASTVLLLRRYNTGYEDGKYGLVGGHLEPDECVTAAAIRECREEVGVDIDPADLTPLGVSHYTDPIGDGIDFFFLATRWSGEPYPRDECDSLRWCALDALPIETIGFVRRAIQHHLQGGVWFDEVGWR